MPHLIGCPKRSEKIYCITNGIRRCGLAELAANSERERCCDGKAKTDGPTQLLTQMTLTGRGKMLWCQMPRYWREGCFGLWLRREEASLEHPTPGALILYPPIKNGFFNSLS